MDGVKTRVDGVKLSGCGKTGEEGRVAETLGASAKINVYLAVQIYHRLLGSDVSAS